LKLILILEDHKGLLIETDFEMVKEEVKEVEANEVEANEVEANEVEETEEIKQEVETETIPQQ